MEEIKVKAWAVIWEDFALPLYGIKPSDYKERLVGCDTGRYIADRIGVRKRNTELYADYGLYGSKKQAEQYRMKNKEWKVVPCTITFAAPQ